MRTSNPALNERTFEGFGPSFGELTAERSDAMTIKGTATKTTLLLILLIAAAGWSWMQLQGPGGLPAVLPYLIGGAIVAAISALTLYFKPAWAAVLAPVYAVAEGVVLGVISAAYEAQFHGIVFQAACLTFGTLFSLLTAYQTGWIKATENFKLGVVAATGAVMLVYLANFVMSVFFHIRVPFLHDNGLIGIGINAVIVVIAALNLVLDFDFIEEGAARGAPKHMEWYAGFGLLVTLVWLYVEFLRLLSKLNSRD